MAVSKASTFDAVPAELARLFKALAHPARVEIVRFLAQSGTCICGDIVEELPLAQATVSQHLKALKEAGLVKGNVDGPAVCYCLNFDALQRMKEAVGSYFEAIQPTCC